jgi:hypothetical protein
MFFVFFVDNWTWKVEQTTGPAPSARYGHAACMYNQKIMIIAGGRDIDQALRDVYAYDTGKK